MTPSPTATAGDPINPNNVDFLSALPPWVVIGTIVVAVIGAVVTPWMTGRQQRTLRDRLARDIAAWEKLPATTPPSPQAYDGPRERLYVHIGRLVDELTAVRHLRYQKVVLELLRTTAWASAITLIFGVFCAATADYAWVNPWGSWGVKGNVVFVLVWIGAFILASSGAAMMAVLFVVLTPLTIVWLLSRRTR